MFDLGRKNSFTVKIFRFDTSKYEFQKPKDNLGKDSFKKEYQIVKAKLFNDHFFKKGIVNEETAYFYGIALTDGFVIAGKKTPYFGLQLSKDDDDIIYTLSKIIKHKGQIYTSKRKYSYLTLTSRYFVNDLEALGCVPRKSSIAHYPLIQKESLHRHFIRGLIDGDGSFYLSGKKYLKFKFCGNDQLVYGLYYILKKELGVTPKLLDYRDYQKTLKMKSFCEIVYSKQDAGRIRDWVYKTSKYLYCRRKFAKAHFEPEFDTSRDQMTPKKLAKLTGLSDMFFLRYFKRTNFPIKKFGKIYTVEQKNLMKLYKDVLKHVKSLPVNKGNFPLEHKNKIIKNITSNI